MSTLVEKVVSFVENFPVVQNGTKLNKEEAEAVIWKCLSDSRIGVSKDDPQTHCMLNHDLIGEKDFRTVFCEEYKIALPCVRALMKEVLKGKTSTEQVESKENSGVLNAVVDMLKANKPIGQYKTKELLENYNADSSSEIWTELNSRAKGLHCIVFNKDGSVNIEVSNNILQSIRKLNVSGQIYSDGKQTYRVYLVGSFPEDTVLCCPITGKILNNGFSQDLGINWNGVTEEALVFIRVIRDQNRSEVIGKFGAKQLLKTAKEGGVEALKEEYPTEYLVFEDLKSLNRLPSLRVNLNSLAEGRRVERGVLDPFGSPRRT